MANKTHKRAAAAILLQDMDILTGYWYERREAVPEHDEHKINEAMAALVEPFLRRLGNVAKDVSADAYASTETD